MRQLVGALVFLLKQCRQGTAPRSRPSTQILCYTGLNLDLRRSILIMTNEEWDRKVEFLLNQQARHDAVMQELDQKLKEAETSSKRQFERTEEVLSQLADATLELIATMTAGFRSTFDQIKHSNKKIDVLVNSQMHTDERILDSYKRMKESEKRLSEHDKIFQNLTVQFERHLRKYHRGGNGSKN